MDFRWVVAVMVVMAILDMIGRMLRKQAGELPEAKGDTVKGADVLKYLTGEEPEPPGADSPARAGRDRTGAPVHLRTEAAGVADTRTAVAPVPAGGPRLPEMRDRAPREIEVRNRSPREIELRSRDPRGMEVRSREPRPLVSRPSPAQAHSAPGEPPSADSVPPPGGVPARDAPVGRDARPLPPPPTLARRSVNLADQLGLDGAGALRRAVLAREVLGSPLALREELREDR